MVSMRKLSTHNNSIILQTDPYERNSNIGTRQKKVEGRFGVSPISHKIESHKQNLFPNRFQEHSTRWRPVPDITKSLNSRRARKFVCAKKRGKINFRQQLASIPTRAAEVVTVQRLETRENWAQRSVNRLFDPYDTKTSVWSESRAICDSR